VWRFDCDPDAPKTNVHGFVGNRKESPSNIKGTPVFHEGRLYVAAGGDIWWGKREAWLQCIDPSGTGDISESGRLWACPLDRHCCSTPSIQEGLVFVGDCGRNLRCIDVDTGEVHWVHKTRGEIWGSPLVADGKVYVGSRRGDFWVLAAEREKKVISSIEFEDGVIGTPIAANGVLYIATMKDLYAIEEQAKK
jgi:outer membrane protein assembly factor BamB